MIDKDVRSHLMFGMAVLVVAMLTVCAAAIITADPDEAEAATYTVESGKTVTVSTGFSSDDISSIVDGYADWSVHGSIVGQFSSKTISPDYLSITLQIKDTTAPGTYSCRITLDILHTSDETLTAEHSIRVTAPAPPSIRITSAGGTTAIVGTEYLYEVQTVPSDARITVSGADWLSADGHAVHGTPTAPGSFTVTIHATAAGYTEAVETVVIVVSEAPPGAPSISAINYAISPSDPYSVSFVVRGENLGAVSIDFGDGQHGTGPAVTHTYGASGVYTVRVTAGQGATAVSDSVQVTLADHSPIRYAFYNQPYAYTIGMDTSAGGSPTLTGCPFLAASLDTGVIKVRGTPTSTAYVGQTYSVTLTYGDFSQSWSVTVREGASDPVAGFSYTVDGLTVHVTSTATNATQISYRWTGGGSFSPCATTETSHTYDAPGLYIITQKAVRSDGGTIRTDEYSATVTVTAPGGPPPVQHDAAWSAVAVMIVGILLLLASARFGLVPLAAVGIAAVVGGAVWWFF